MSHPAEKLKSFIIELVEVNYVPCIQIAYLSLGKVKKTFNRIFLRGKIYLIIRY